jgi:predicted metal-binding protein
MLRPVRGYSIQVVRKMNSKEPLDCAIRAIPIDSLRRYHKPEETAGHCERCPRYGTSWSCPPHDFSVTDYFERYGMAYAIATKVSLPGLANEPDSMDYYHQCRHSINQRLLQYETEIPDSVVLIAGNCNLCDDCTRPAPSECRLSQGQRYSFESLGFKVSGIIEDFFDDTLQWGKGRTPDSLYIVSGILSNAALDVGELDKAIAGSCDGATHSPRR